MSQASPFTVEILEFVDGRASPMRPVFGAFTSLAEANKVGMLRVFFGAPNPNGVGFRVFDRDRQKVSEWQPGGGRAAR